MRPKYSSPGAELLKSSHCKCAHLLVSDLHGSFFGLGEAAGAAEVETGAASPAPTIESSASAAKIFTLMERKRFPRAQRSPPGAKKGAHTSPARTAAT